jgi:hypothetical protein
MQLVERIPSGLLDGLPWTRRPRASCVRRQRVLKPALGEHRAPAPPVVAPELEVVLLPRHPGDDIPDPGPRVEPAVEDAQLRLTRLDAQEAEGRA